PHRSGGAHLHDGRLRGAHGRDRDAPDSAVSAQRAVHSGDLLLVNWDAPVTCDPSIREGLQRVDPTAELLYLAQGMWALVAKPEGVNPAGRKRIGRALLERMRGRPDADPVTVRCAKLLAEGYGI